MNAEVNLVVRKNFRNVWNKLRANVDELGDIRLAGFIAQHWLKEPLCVASIGIPTEAEFLALNSLVDPAASFIVLVSEPSDAKHVRVKELNDHARNMGFDVRTQVADLTLPGRWAQLLPALSEKNVGLLRVVAQWALKESRFWENLRNFVSATQCVVCIRGALNYRRPDVSVRFLSSLPNNCPVEVIAATRTSLWLAPSASCAKSLREALRTSGLAGKAQLESGADDAAVFIDNVWGEGWVDDDGRVPRAVYNAHDYELAGIEFGSGWSSPEPDGRWTEGATAAVMVTLPDGASLAKRVSVVGNAWIPRTEPPQIIHVGVGRDPAKWIEQRFEDPGEIRTIYLEVAKTDIVNNCIAIQLKVQKPGRPIDYGDADSRVLGFKLRSIGLIT